MPTVQKEIVCVEDVAAILSMMYTMMKYDWLKTYSSHLEGFPCIFKVHFLDMID
jgi:hypothetical protein